MDVARSVFTISSIELSCSNEYVIDERNQLRSGDSIVYDSARFAAMPTECIFYGPYYTLMPGVYLFEFNGELIGELRLDFAEQEGTVILKSLTIDNLLDPVCLAITKTATKFEVRGFRTSSLNTLRLDSISVEAITFPSRS